MRVTTRIVWDWDGNVLDEETADYSGPVAECKGSTSYGNTSGTSTSTPWAPQQDYLLEGFQRAGTNLRNPPQYYPDSTVAPFSDATKVGLNWMTDSAKVGPNIIGSANDALVNTLQGYYQKTPQQWAGQFTNPNVGATNPNMGQNPNGYIDELTSSISRQVMPEVSGSYAMAGRTGSSPVAQQAMAKGIADALAPYQFGSAEAAQQRQFTGGENAANRQFNAGESAASRSLSAYGAEQDRMMGAISQAPATYDARFAPAEKMLAAGSMQDALSQAYLNDAVAKWDHEQNAPITALENYMSTIQGGYGGTTKSSGVSPVGHTYPGQNIANLGLRAGGK